MLKLDDKDHKIIAVLKENSRTSIRSIAKKTKIRPSTVHQRISKLKENGVIERFTLKLDNKAVGEDFIVIMLVKGDTTDYFTDVDLSNDNVKEAFGVTGDHDIMLKLKFKDINEFNEYVINFRKAHKFVRSTVTLVVTAVLKEEL